MHPLKRVCAALFLAILAIFQEKSPLAPRPFLDSFPSKSPDSCKIPLIYPFFKPTHFGAVGGIFYRINTSVSIARALFKHKIGPSPTNPSTGLFLSQIDLWGQKPHPKEIFRARAAFLKKLQLSLVFS